MPGKNTPRSHLTLIKGGLADKTNTSVNHRWAAMQRWIENHCPNIISELKALCQHHPVFLTDGLDPQVFYESMLSEAFEIYCGSDYSQAREWLIAKILKMKGEMEDRTFFIPDACMDKS